MCLYGSFSILQRISNLTAMNRVSLLKSLMNQLTKLESTSGNGKRVIIRDYLNSQFSTPNDVTLHKPDLFLSAYTDYLVSRSNLNRLNGKYAKGERSIEQTASIVGLSLPRSNS